MLDDDSLFSNSTTATQQARPIANARSRGDDQADEDPLKFIEPRILTGMIVSTDFLSRIAPVYDPLFIHSTEARAIARWVFEYYHEYGEAPGRHMEDIYTEKLRNGDISGDRADFIEEILTRAARNYERSDEFNVDYLFDQAREYFNERRYELLAERVQNLADAGATDEAAKELEQFDPHALAGDSDDPREAIKPLSTLKEQKLERPPLLIKPWLRAGETNIIYAQDGVGKTLLALLISYIAGLECYDTEDAEIGEWQVKRPTGTLYIDGEQGEIDLTRQLREFEWLGEQRADCEIQTLCAPDYQRATDKQLDLSQRSTQQRIERWLQDNPNYRLVVIDSATTLFGLENESDNSEWAARVQPFIKRLRAQGVAHIILDHAGKNGDLRGASAKRAMASNVFKLADTPNKSDSEAWFELYKQKQREADAGFRPFSLRFYRPEEGRTEFTTDTARSSANREQAIVAEIVRGARRSKDIATAFQVDRSRVSQLKKKAQDGGYLNEDGSATEAGRRLTEQYSPPEPGSAG